MKSRVGTRVGISHSPPPEFPAWLLMISTSSSTISYGRNPASMAAIYPHPAAQYWSLNTSLATAHSSLQGSPCHVLFKSRFTVQSLRVGVRVDG
eukprot:2135172-Rhodomonas_salina.1